MTVHKASVDEASVEAYEAMRTHMLTGSTLSRGTGLMVLLRQGVAAWRARRGGRPVPIAPMPPTTTPQVADERQAALVHVLVSMVLGDRQQACR